MLNNSDAEFPGLEVEGRELWKEGDDMAEQDKQFRHREVIQYTDTLLMPQRSNRVRRLKE